MDTIARLNELLEDHCMTVTELSERSGISRSTLSAAFRRNTQLSVDTIERICTGAFQMPIFEFFATDSDWKSLDDYSKMRGHSHGYKY